MINDKKTLRVFFMKNKTKKYFFDNFLFFETTEKDQEL